MEAAMADGFAADRRNPADILIDLAPPPVRLGRAADALAPARPARAQCREQEAADGSVDVPADAPLPLFSWSTSPRTGRPNAPACSARRDGPRPACACASARPRRGPGRLWRAARRTGSRDDGGAHRPATAGPGERHPPPGRPPAGRGWTAGHRVSGHPTSASEEAGHDDGRSVMAGVVERIKQFARSPQGRRTIEQVRRTAADPRRRAQARELVRKLRGRP
ncbi:hypothetical protein GCM10010236_36430 [Streptomyces eurythermus]|nr:hypothetical protein GCM10010236_36430 [Streptomyces eurythermus]